MKTAGVRASEPSVRTEDRSVLAPSRRRAQAASEQSPVVPTRGHLEDLSRDECILRLEASGVGRVAAVLDSRPYIFPVNYVVHEGAIVFRTRDGSRLHKATFDSYAALEIDSADFMYHEGWSVLVQGRSSHVVDKDDVVALAQVCVVPWVDDARDSFVRIHLEEVQGERISHRFPEPAPRSAPEAIPNSREGPGQGRA